MSDIRSRILISASKRLAAHRANARARISGQQAMWQLQQQQQQLNKIQVWPAELVGLIVIYK